MRRQRPYREVRRQATAFERRLARAAKRNPARRPGMFASVGDALYSVALWVGCTIAIAVVGMALTGIYRMVYALLGGV